MSIRINNRPIADLVYQVLVLDGHLAPSLPRASTVTLAQSGGTFGSVITVDPRRITVGLDVRPVSLPDRQAVLDSLKRRLHRELLELTTDDLPGRRLRVIAEPPTVEFYTGAYANPVIYVGLTFLAPDPVRHDVQPLVNGLSTARTPCPLGTETVAPRLWLYGASPSVVNPVVIVREHTGVEVMRLTLTGTLATNDALVIDSATQQVERYVSGVLQTGTASGLGWVTSGRFPVLDPAHTNPDAPAWGTIELAATSGTPTGLTAYHRRW
jgi:hypothetical protein